MVQVKELNTFKLSEKLAEAQDMDINSGFSTDASESSSMYYSEKQRKHERYVRARDQIVFCLNVLSLLVCCVLLTKNPKYYVYWNALIIPFLMIHRTFDFQSKGWQFYMIDFCYAVNLLVVITTVFFPSCLILSLISFGLALGTLTFAIYFFRNSLAFTSIEKVTSLFIHFQAPLTMFLLRWHDHSGNFAISSATLSDFGLSFLAKWFGGIIGFYGVWALFYCSMIFLVFGKHISRRNLQTLYSYSMSDPKHSKKLLSRGAKWSKFLFMFNHFKVVVGLSTVTVAFFFSYWLGLLWLLSNLLIALYNGATYTVEFHSLKYEKQFTHKNKWN
mmetsp:Transcript_66280/g.76921  ORF Transcript_66280/g.76921 Transcript_66280/m.76921 type:complete len:331 (-) Transcript_66280:162-1154(-)